MTRTQNRPPLDRAYLHLIRSDLAPVGALESLLADRVALVACRLKVASDRERYSRPARAIARSRTARQIEDEFRQALNRFTAFKADRLAKSKPPAGHNDDPTTDFRVKLQPTLGDGTPLIKGTLISAGRVVSHIVDGWSWPEILSVYPELTESDIRDCLAYTVEDDEHRYFA